VFYGLAHQSGRALGAFAVLEGVAFGLADGLAALRASGTTANRLSLVGGGARSALWAQLIADTLDVEIVLHAGADAGGALGAARLGWMACGASVAEACSKPEVTARFLPDAARADVLASRLQRFRQIYRQLKPLWGPAAA
jgi:xylulokinase